MKLPAYVLLPLCLFASVAFCIWVFGDIRDARRVKIGVLEFVFICLLRGGVGAILFTAFTLYFIRGLLVGKLDLSDRLTVP